MPMAVSGLTIWLFLTCPTSMTVIRAKTRAPTRYGSPKDGNDYAGKDGVRNGVSISDHPMCVIQQLKRPHTSAVARPVTKARCMNAYLRISISGMRHLLDMSVFAQSQAGEVRCFSKHRTQDLGKVIVLLITRQSWKFSRAEWMSWMETAACVPLLQEGGAAG